MRFCGLWIRTTWGSTISTQNNNVQNFTATNPPVLSSPVYWNSPNFGPVIYLWGQADFPKAWAFNAQTSQFNTTPVIRRASFQELHRTPPRYPCPRMRARAVPGSSGHPGRFLDLPIRARLPAYSTLSTQPILRPNSGTANKTAPATQ